VKPKTYYIFLCCIVCFFWQTSYQAFAQSKKKVISKNQEFLVGKLLDFYVDTTGKYTIKDIASPTFADRFIRSDKDILNFGFTDAVIWTKLEIKGDTKIARQYIIEINYPLIDKLTIYRQANDSTWEESTEGDAFPFGKREIAHHNIAHTIEVSPNKTSVFYLRFETEGSMQIPIFLWQPKDFYNAAFNENMIFGILFGTLFVVVAYNVFLFWISLRSVYLLFAGMIVSSVSFLATLNGYAFKYLWSDATIWGNQALPLSIGLLTLLTCIFVIWILEIQRYSLIMHVLLVCLAFIGSLSALTPFFFSYNFCIKFGLLNGLAAALFTLVSSVVCRLRGGLQARYLIPASYLYLIGILLVALKSFGIIETTFISTHGVELGSVCQAIFYSLALREKYANVAN
jgi:two-component system, sensor histidine kinase LadS